MTRWSRPTLLVLSLLGAAEARGAGIAVDVELVLAVDVSRSMTPGELEIQRRGYAAALASDEVIGAIERGALGRIAVLYVEWAGPLAQRVVIGWRAIGSREAALAYAAELLAPQGGTLRRTSISGALDFAAAELDSNGYDGDRRVIDVSGDGPNNDGRPVTEARDAALARDITINGLPLMTREGAGTLWHLPDLDAYYRNCVTGGPLSFVMPVNDWAEFPVAVRRKLVLELSGQPAMGPERLTDAAATGYDCLIGEKMWEQNRRYWEER